MNRHTYCCLVFYLCYFFSNVTTGMARPAGKHPAFKIYDIRCQSLNNPLGIGESNPYFSWKIASSRRGVIQYAYQIVVASSLHNLEEDPDLWDSGKVITDQNTFIYYAGKSLHSAGKYYWKVKVWINQEQKGLCSQPSFFVTGILQDKEWKEAKWIAYEALPDSLKVFPGVHGNGHQLGEKAVKRAVIPCFRKNIFIKKQISQAFIYTCGLGQYALYLNGDRVDSTFLNPAWSDYTKRCYYNTYEITSLLKSGANTIGAIAGTGFLYINRERYRKLVIAAGYPMLRLAMVVHYTDGSTEKIVTDNSWKTTASAITYSSIYGGEACNANKIQKNWNRPQFNDATWRSVITVPGPGGKMQAQEDYPVRIDEAFQPVQTDWVQGSKYIYDFGQNISGIIRLRVNGHKGYRVRITPAELLNEEHLPDQSASGKPYYWEYILSGNGEETWQPLFSYYGFRYAGLEVFDSAGQPVKIRKGLTSLSLVSLHIQNSAPQAGDFECSDTLFNQIFSLIRWGIRNNMSGIATDCPHREKLGWLEETHLMGNSIRYNYDISNFYNKIADDIHDAQLPNGMIPDIAPEYVIFKNGFRDSPEWGSACVLLPWYLYRWYGDKQVLEKSYVSIKRYVEYLRSKSDHYLLNYGLGDWFDIGPKPPGVSQLTSSGLTATAFYYYDAFILSKVAAVLHDQKTAKQYAALADSVRRRFNEKYFNPVTKVYDTGSQTSYAMPLYLGIVENRYREEVFNNFVRSIKENNNALTAGDIGFKYVVQALEEGNANQLIYEMNCRSDVPGYGYQIRQGATALTESWQALKNVSNDHMMLGHLMEWFYSGLAGIRQQKDDTGFKRILIAPQWIKGINRVNCNYNSVNGPVIVQWVRSKHSATRLHIEIPANTTAKVHIPVTSPGAVSESNKKISGRRDMKIIRITDKETIISLGSGNYSFVIPLKN